MVAPSGMTELFKAVESYVKAAFDAVSARITAIETRVHTLPTPAKGDPGVNGKDADPADVAKLLMPMIEEKIAAAVAALPPPPKGEKGDAGESIDWERVYNRLGELVAAIPKPVDGKDGRDGKDADWERIYARLGELVAAIPKPTNGENGKDGKDADMPAVLAHAEIIVRDAVAALPRPRDGIDGKDADMTALIAVAESEARRVAESIPRPRDGKDVDYVALSGLVTDAVAKAVAALPRPMNGRDATEINPLPGIDFARSYAAGTWAKHAGGLWLSRIDTKGTEGWDCIQNGIASVEIEQGGERSFSINVTQSNGQKATQAFIVPTPLDTGVYQPDRKYWKGDGVTYAGSWFLAQVDDPQGVPGASKDWRLAVKRGRDGRDAEAPKPAPGRVKIGTS